MPVFFLAGDPPYPPHVCWGGGCLYFFLAGDPPYPLPLFGWRVYPPPRYPRRYPPPVFRDRFHVGEQIFHMVYFGCETLPPLAWWGGGCLSFFSSRGTPHPPPAIWFEGIPPQRYPRWHPPPVFRHGFTSETPFSSSPKKGIGRGDPQGANGRRPPPPCLSMGGGCLSGAPGGWGYPTFVPPVNGRHPPPRYPRWHPPPVFRHGFTSETPFSSSPKKGIGRGNPHLNLDILSLTSTIPPSGDDKLNRQMKIRAGI